MWILLLLPLRHAETPWILVVHESVPLAGITLFQARQLYLGRVEKIAGQALRPIRNGQSDPLQEAFENEVFPDGFDLENYWLTQTIDQGARPPVTAGTWELALVMASRNPGFLALVPPLDSQTLRQYHLKVLPLQR
jgi:hypothetical protein